MFLNMDRNTLWGAAGGMVFEHETSWDAADRFRGVESGSGTVLDEAGRALCVPGATAFALFNPLNWKREDPVTLNASEVPEGIPSELLPDGRALCRPLLGSVSLTPVKSAAKPAVAAASIALPEIIENRFYIARVDAGTGCLVSLKMKPSGREMLGGPANLVIAERPVKQSGDPGDH